MLVAGDVFQADDFSRLVDHYNQTTRHWLRPLEHGGANGVFAMLTTRQMRRYGLERADYGRLAVAQRKWAMLSLATVVHESGVRLIARTAEALPAGPFLALAKRDSRSIA